MWIFGKEIWCRLRRFFGGGGFGVGSWLGGEEAGGRCMGEVMGVGCYGSMRGIGVKYVE